MWSRAIPHRSGSIDLRTIDDSIAVDIASLLNSVTLASNAANTQLTSRNGNSESLLEFPTISRWLHWFCADLLQTESTFTYKRRATPIRRLSLDIRRTVRRLLRWLLRYMMMPLGSSTSADELEGCPGGAKPPAILCDPCSYWDCGAQNLALRALCDCAVKNEALVVYNDRVQTNCGAEWLRSTTRKTTNLYPKEKNLS